MSKTIEYLLIFGCGVAAGALCAQQYFDAKYKAIAEEEIASVKEVYGRKYREPEPDIPKKKAEKEERVVESVPPHDRKVADFGYSTQSRSVDATDYHKFYESKDEEDNIEVRLAEKEAPSESDYPYLITDDEYSDTEVSFDKISCTFYVPDQVLVDDLSREVVEPYVYGEDNVEYLVNTDKSLIYIRNEKLGCDMEISRDMNSIEESGAKVWFG